VTVLSMVTTSGSQASSRPHESAAREGQPTKAAALRVVTTPIPRLDVPRYDTSGVFPQVRGSSLDLRAVNAGLRGAVVSDQRAYAPSARRYAQIAAKRYRGVYTTRVDRRLVSASTTVVSALLPLTRLYPGGSDGRGWLAVTLQVPSGRRVTLTSLFANRVEGIRVLAAAWKARIRRTRNAPCVRIYQSVYAPTAQNYRFFALTPVGVAVGAWEVGPCSGLLATVPYRILRPHLSRFGATLVDGVRSPKWTR